MKKEDSLKIDNKTAGRKGRPITPTKEISNTSRLGTKENETRATFIVSEQILDKLKSIAYWDRVTIKEVVGQALEEAVTKREREGGEVLPIPEKRPIGEI